VWHFCHTFANIKLLRSSVVADHEARTILTEPVGAITWVSVAHEVASGATALNRLNLPIAVLLDLLTNVAHGSAEVLNSILGLCFARVDTPTTGEMIDDLTLLGESDCAVCHNDNIPFLSFL
jgi:hypothetical protein